METLQDNRGQLVPTWSFPYLPGYFILYCQENVDRPAYEMTGELHYIAENNMTIREFGCNFSTYYESKKQQLKGIAASKQYGHITASYPKYEFFRYREAMRGKAPTKSSKKFHFLSRNEDDFAFRMVTYLLNLPAGKCANFVYEDVRHFLSMAYSHCNIENLSNNAWLKFYLKAKNPFAGRAQYFVECSKESVKIVGELRGDFEALRKILSILSNLPEKEKGHSMEDYVWVFMGNYAIGHPQSLETIMLSLGCSTFSRRIASSCCEGHSNLRSSTRSMDSRIC